MQTGEGSKGGSPGTALVSGAVLVLGFISFRSYQLLSDLKEGYESMVEATKNYHPPTIRSEWTDAAGIVHEITTTGAMDQDRDSLMQQHRAELDKGLRDYPQRSR